MWGRRWLCALLVAAPLAAEWEAAAYVGAAHTLSSSLLLDQPALGNALRFRPVSYRGESFTPPLYYGYRAGWFPKRYLGFETELIHLKVFAETGRTAFGSGTLEGRPVNGPARIDTVVSRFSISHGVNLLRGIVVSRRDLARRLMLTARAGAGTSIPHVETTVLGQADEHYQIGSPAWQLAVGLEYRLWRGLHALGEYKFTHTREHVRLATGTAATLLETHHAVFGLAWHF